jgi:outer membrane protein assembly factor BamB
MGRTRAIAGWLPALLLVGGGMSVAAVVAVPEDQEAATRDLLPLDVGTTWVYAVSDHGKPSGTHTRQVLERGNLITQAGDLVTGTAHLREGYTDYPSTGPRETQTYLASNGARIDQYGVGLPDHSFQAFDPPAKVYAVADVGDSWSYHGTLGINDFSFHAERAEKGNVTVGGHTFEDCNRSVTTVPVDIEGQPDAAEVLEEWTCPGYGPVRSSDTLDAIDFAVTEELVEFHGQVGNWYAGGQRPDEPEDAPASADPTLTALGFDQARTNSVPDGQLGKDLAWTMSREITGDHPPVAAGSLMINDDQNGWVAATDVRTGEQVWQVRLAPPILVTPTVTPDSVLVADGSKRLWSLSLSDGRTRWVHDFDDVVSVAPTATATAAVVATDDARLTALDLHDGSTLWSVELAGRASSTLALDDDRAYVCDGTGGISAIDLKDGTVAWDRTLSEGALTGPTLAGDRVLAQDDDGIVYAFAADDGKVAWESRTRGEQSPALAATDDTAVLLTNFRELEAIDLADGTRRWRRRVAETSVAPAIVGSEVVTVSTKGRVETLALEDGSTGATWELPRPSADAPYVRTQLGLVDDALVITSDVGTQPANRTLWAYPVGPDAGTDGVLLDVALRPIPSPPTEPVAMLGDDVLLPGFDGALHRVDPSGRSSEVLRNATRIGTAPTVAGDVLVVRRDDQLEALPAAGGAPLWSVTVGDAFAGSRPAVTHTTVYAGTSDGRLLALALEDGTESWEASVDENSLPRTPLLLPGGDVVYGVGLARYDGATGAPVWSQPGTDLLGTPVEGNGRIYGAGFGSDGVAGLGAWDAGTGEPAWFLPGSPDSYVGPAFADGTVFWLDGQGTVHAVDASDGTELWAVSLHRPAGGVPVVADGRVYLTALGRPEDADERDGRVVVLDARSGRFLGSWEPPTTQNWIVPAAGPGGDATLLVPTGTSGTQLAEVRPHG